MDEDKNLLHRVEKLEILCEALTRAMAHHHPRGRSNSARVNQWLQERYDEYVQANKDILKGTFL